MLIISFLCIGSPPSLPKGASNGLPFSLVFLVEFLCTVIYALTFVADLATKGGLHIAGDEIYGYTIVVDVVGVIAWLFSLVILYRERVLVVTHRPHGLTLVLFWLMSVVILGLELVSIRSPSSDWWWHLRSRADIADLTLFCVRAVLVGVLVVLGVFQPICCPGRRRSYSLIINAESAAVDVNVGEEEAAKASERKSKEGDFVKSRTTSTFANIWSKIRRLFPYVWPKGKSCLHNVYAVFMIWQLLQFSCVFVLAWQCVACVSRFFYFFFVQVILSFSCV